MRNSLLPVLAIVAMALLAGCTSSSHIMIGSTRAPVDPSTVQLYVEPPATFETIAIIDVETGAGWNKQGSTDIVVERMREEAAALGANGIILGSTTDDAARPSLIPVISSGDGVSILTGHDGPNARIAGQAIYVPDEPSVEQATFEAAIR